MTAQEDRLLEKLKNVYQKAALEIDEVEGQLEQLRERHLKLREAVAWVIGFHWGTSVTEAEHFARVAAMVNLRETFKETGQV